METKVAQIQADATAAIDALRERTGAQRIVTVGFCFGGLQSFLAATNPDLGLAGVVGFYGVLAGGRMGMPSMLDQAGQVSRPLLGLFGNDDKYPSPEHVDELEEALQKAGKTYEFHRYDGAGHGFFSVNRPGYRPEAAVDGWQQIWKFYGKYLSA